MTASDPDQDDESPRKKSSVQKDANHMLRQEQIQLYKSTVLKEQREQRMRVRHSQQPDESPKKKKRVSFHVELSTERKREETPGGLKEVMDKKDTHKMSITSDTQNEPRGTEKELRDAPKELRDAPEDNSSTQSDTAQTREPASQSSRSLDTKWTLHHDRLALAT